MNTCRNCGFVWSDDIDDHGAHDCLEVKEAQRIRYKEALTIIGNRDKDCTGSCRIIARKALEEKG